MIKTNSLFWGFIGPSKTLEPFSSKLVMITKIMYWYQMKALLRGLKNTIVYRWLICNFWEKQGAFMQGGQNGSAVFFLFSWYILKNILIRNNHFSVQRWDNPQCFRLPPGFWPHWRSRDFSGTPLDHCLTLGQQVMFLSLELQEVPVFPQRLSSHSYQQADHWRTKWALTWIKLIT